MSAYRIAMVSQKGGVGKSTLARIIAVEAAKSGLNTKIADLDTQQTTSTQWSARRAENGYEPHIRSEPFRSVRAAIADSEQFDVYIFDGAPHSSAETREACRAAHMIIIPTSEGLDDLQPSVVLANNLLQANIPPSRIAFALCITSNSERELAAAREYLGQTPYGILDGEIPFRSSFKTALDKGKAVTETPYPTLRAKADAMAQGIIDAVAAAAEIEGVA